MSLRALSELVSCINLIRHEALFHLLFWMSMWHCRPNVMDAFIELSISMAASSGKFIDACLDNFVNNFCPPNNVLHIIDKSRGPLLKQQVFDWVQFVIHEIVDLVLLTPSRLDHKVSNRMPRPPDDR